MIQVPKGFAENQERAIRDKMKEAREKLDVFLEKENITIKPIIRNTPDGIFPDIMVIPNEFLKKGEEEKSESIITLPKTEAK